MRVHSVWIHTFLIAAVVTIAGNRAQGHCQIPCGIYDDPIRLTLMAEHITTIEKSMKQIAELSGADEENYNQLVRWVQNKEAHAEAFGEIVTDYFMMQRIKPVDAASKDAHAKYVHEVTLLHELLVYAMKAKQTTDLDLIAKLRTTLGEFERVYMGAQTAAAHSDAH